MEAGAQLVQAKEASHELDLVETSVEEEPCELDEVLLGQCTSSVEIIPSWPVRVVKEGIVPVSIARQAAHR
jgi:hypothetical protein